MNDDNIIYKDSNESKDIGTEPDNSKVLSEYKSKIENLESKLEETYNLFLRSEADLDNLKKRSSREIEHSVRYANKKFLLDLLPLIDSLEACLNVKCKIDEDNDIVIFYKMLLSILNGFNLKQIIAKPYFEFDPLKHEAVSFVESDEHDNVICEVIQSGYTLYDQVLRYSKVTIFKKK